MTVIYLSLLAVGIFLLTAWSIYHRLFIDHLSVLLEIIHKHNNERGTVPKRWLTQHADCEHIAEATTNMKLKDIDTNEANITKAILEAAVISIPKSSGK